MSSSPQSEGEDDHDSRMRDKFRKERDDSADNYESKKGKKRDREEGDKKDEFGRSVREKDRDRERRDKDRRSPRESRRHSPRDRRSSSNTRERAHSPPYKRDRRDEIIPDWDRPEFNYPFRDRPFVPMPPPMHRAPFPDPMAFGPPEQRPPKQRSNRSQDIYEGSLKTYKQFLETQDDNITPQEAEKKYEEYKEEYKKRQARTFFREHKVEEWFREKYDPPYLERHKVERDSTAVAKSRAFTQLLTDESTKFSLDADSHLEEGEQIEEIEEEPEEGSLQEGSLEAEEIPKEEKGEEVEEGEEVKEESGDKEENATTPTGEDTLAKMIPTKPSAQRKNDKLDMALEPPKRGVEPPRDPNTLFIKTVTPTCSRSELLEVLNRVGQPGEQVCTLLLSEPMRYKNFHRIGWVTYKTHELCLQALRELNNHKFKDFELQMTINRPNNPDSKPRFKVTPDTANHEDRVAHDLEQSLALMQLLDKEKGIDENPLLSFTHWPDLSARDKLDRVLYYLRFAHFFCYYCGEEFEDEGDLRRRCGTVHVRGRPKKTDGESVSNEKATAWAENLDKKIRTRLQKVIDPDVYTGKELVTKAMDEVYNENIKKLEDEKYRCAFCNKLFRGDEFVKKHITLKHDGPLKDAKQKGLDEQFFQNYWNDPRHILPTTGQQQLSSNQGGGLLHHPQKHGRRQAWDYTPPEPVYMMRMPLPPPPPPQVVPGGRGGRGGPFRGAGRPSPARGRADPRPYPSPGRPPSGGFQDPRGIREYVDLDAPADDLPQIDYRTGLSSSSDQA